MSLFGPPDVAKLKAKGDILGLAAAITYRKNPEVRAAAADALGQCGAPAVEPLMVALKDPIATIYAAKALGRIGGPALAPLIVALMDQREAVRQAAAGALGQIGDSRAVAPLIVALKDPRSYWAAANALGRIGTPAIEPLSIALKDQDVNVRQAAAAALGQMGDARVIGPLISALGDQNPGGREAAAKALGQMREPLVINPLIAALGDQASRTMAVSTLIKVGGPAVKPLAAALGDRNSDPEVRLAIVRALGDIRHRRAVEPLIAALDDPSEKVRESVIWCLGDFRDARAVGPLVAALEDRNERVRKAVAETLDKLAWRPDSGAAGAAYWAAKSRWDMCVKIGAPAVEALITALETGDRKSVWNSAQALGQIGDARAIEPLVAVLREPNIRLVAEGALEKLAWKPDNGETGAIYWLLRNKWDQCAQIGAPAVDSLLGVLASPQSSVRRGAAEALVTIYQSGTLDETQKTKLLAQRDTMIEAHFDVRSECGYHTDRGIGVEFPI